MSRCNLESMTLEMGKIPPVENCKCPWIGMERFGKGMEVFKDEFKRELHYSPTPLKEEEDEGEGAFLS